MAETGWFGPIDSGCRYTGFVKARVYVTFKPSVLDPQGQTIRAALNGLGHRGIEDVRQGKYFEITMQPGEDLDSIARDVLSNPVIEDYRIEFLDPRS